MVLFKTTDELKAAGVSVNNSFTLAPVEPYLESVWRELLPQFVGFDQVETWEEIYAESPTDEEKVLLGYLQRVVGRLGFAQYLPFAEVQISDDGITISGNDQRKAAYERQVKQIRTTLLETGWKALEALLVFLDAHQDEYDDFKIFRVAQQPRLLASAAEFSQYYQIGASRVTFNALLPTLDRLTQDTLVPQFGDKWPDILTSLDLLDKRILAKLKSWLAYRTIAEAIPMLAIEITGSGLRLHYSSHIDNVDYYTPPTEAQLNRLIAKAEQISTSAWSDAVTLISPTDSTAESRIIDQTDSKIFIF